MTSNLKRNECGRGMVREKTGRNVALKKRQWGRMWNTDGLSKAERESLGRSTEDEKLAD